jgi:O-antigen/teichoic acid export membrane protein
MSEQNRSFRQIFKATTIFGGVQVFQIIISIVRSKIIAVLLGPAGMGIAGLLISTIALISGFTNFGLSTSAVKNIAAAHATEDSEKISRVIAVFRRLVWFTGLLGTTATIVLSPWLSELTFGNRNYTVAFIWISITLMFNQLSSGWGVLLQGMRQLQYQAKASMLGALLGLMISAPVYYFWRVDGIVPAIIITSILGLSFEWYYGSKTKIRKISLDFKTIVHEGQDMVKMGFVLSISGLITTIGTYVVRVFLNANGGVAEVGLYNAGFSIINTYVGLVFAAMGTDYYPRLSGIAHDRDKANELINQQAEVSILLLSPILSVFIVFINLVIVVLYSGKFLPISSMIQWAALGMYFKAVSWSIAFILVAKGESGLFFWNELLANVYTIVINVIGYKLGGLQGMGISFFVGYILYLLQVYLLTTSRFGFLFTRDFIKVFLLELLFSIGCFMLVRTFQGFWLYAFAAPLMILIFGYSIYQIDKRIGVKDLFERVVLKKR